MTTAETHDPIDDLKKVWWLLLLLGVVSVALGALLILWPCRTLTVVASIFGLFMIFSGSSGSSWPFSTQGPTADG